MPALNPKSGAVEIDFPNTAVTFDPNYSLVTADILVDLVPDDRALVFKMKQSGFDEDDEEKKVIGYDNRWGYYIAAPFKTNLKLNIILSNSLWDWEFDDSAFRPKKEEHYGFYHFKKTTAERIELHVKSTGNPQGPNPPPNPDPDSHPFELKVSMKQPGGGRLPIIIDPDVKNPPPTGLPMIGPNRWVPIVPHS